MSLSRVQKQIINLDVRQHNAPLLRTIPIVLSDSKGRYLQREVDPNRHPENKIFWWCNKGAKTECQFQWLKDNLLTKFEELSSEHLTIYVWLGTCDITHKIGDFIELTSVNNDSVNKICNSYKEIYKFLSGFPTIKVVFLELPFYSIYLWNLYRKHPNPHKYREQDKLLSNQISAVNSFIRETNTVLRAHSPNFGLDLEKCRKHRGKPTEYSHNYGLMQDGVQPHPKRAKVLPVRFRDENFVNTKDIETASDTAVTGQLKVKRFLAQKNIDGKRLYLAHMVGEPAQHAIWLQQNQLGPKAKAKLNSRPPPYVD